MEPANATEEMELLPGIGPILARILSQRGIRNPAEADEFLHHRYSGHRDPFLLSDMDRAVHRIQRAVENEELIVVYGDFDADGVSATVLMTQALRKLGLDRRQVQPYIPDRVTEGYGLNKKALATLKERGASLVITVDCGIRSTKEVAFAQEMGLDLIITDHHILGRRVPAATAIINPKKSDSNYPERDLAGVGVAFKLAQALKEAMPERARFEDEDLLDLVALGTVADLVPLLGENRVLVVDGLAALNRSQRPGITALARVAGLQSADITSESVAFALGPRINAAGRMAHAYDAARLLAANNQPMADEFARNLDRLNKERQKITAEYTELAEREVDLDQPILVIDHPDFQSGVVGLVASRLADKYYRPAVVLKREPEKSRASCRSIPGFHITEALDKVADLLERYGGHDMAAGLTIRNENLPAFRSRMTEVVEEALDPEDLVPTLYVDAALNLADVDWSLHGFLEQLEPTGSENGKPIFASRAVPVIGTRAVGRDGSHLQLWVGDDQKRLHCIAFRMGDLANQLPEKVDIAYTINKNSWNGRSDLQLVIKDIHSQDDPGFSGGDQV